MKKIKMFMGAVLCMNLLAVSGCDRVVQSAVVEEKDQTEQKKEEKKESRSGLEEEKCPPRPAPGENARNDSGRESTDLDRGIQKIVGDQMLNHAGV